MDINAAIANFDIRAWALDLGGEEQGGDEIALWCPTCGKQKLILNLERRAWHCWVCEWYQTEIINGRPRRIPVAGAGGFLDLLVLLHGWSRDQARDYVLSHTRITAQDLHQLPEAQLEAGICQDSGRLREIPFPEFAAAIHMPLPYMVKRGLTMDHVRDFGLFWCYNGRLANRLVFPVYEHGKLVYYQARAMWDLRPGEVKAVNPSKKEFGVTTSDVLFNLDVACHFPSVVLTEGPIDAVKVGRDAVCTFGKKISGQQIAKLRQRGVTQVELMWDGPSASEPQGAYEDMARAAQTLCVLFAVKMVYLPQGDPGDYDTERLRAFRLQAQVFQGVAPTL